MEGSATTQKVAAGILIARPLLLKAGIPLVLSVTGFVCARIVIAVRKKSTSRAGCVIVTSPTASTKKAPGTDPADENRGDILDDGRLCKDGLITTCTDSDHDLLPEDSRSSLKQQLLALSSEITESSERGLTLESRFLRICELKERETELLEIGYALQLGSDRLKMLHKELARMERDCMFLVQLSEACRKDLEEVSYRRRVEKLRFRARLKKMKRRLENGQMKMEEKKRELVEMRKEKEELREKLSAAEASAKVEETELACLKHELIKNHEQEKQEDAASSVNEEEKEPGVSRVAGADDDHASHSSRKGKPPRIMKKLKRWGGWIGGDDSKTKVKPSEHVDEKKLDVGFYLRHRPV